MNEERLLLILQNISGVNDFTLVLKEKYSASYYGRYSPFFKKIVLYTLNDKGERFTDRELIEFGIHELAHHLQHHHSNFWRRKHGIAHDPYFYEIVADLTEKVSAFSEYS